jgi:hypothetical protein
MKTLGTVIFFLLILVAAVWYFGPIVIWCILGALAFLVIVCFLEVLCWALGL